MSDDPSWPGDRGGHVWPKDREAVTDDGVHVRYAVRGPAGAPWIVLCAGFCCPDNFWWFLAPELAEHYRVVMLNYRGVGASTTPREPDLFGFGLRSSDYTMERMAADVLAVCDAEDIDSASFVGHSMGCQVELEVFRKAPERVDSLVLVTGPFQSPFHTLYGNHLRPIRGWHLPAVLFPPLYLAGKITPEPLVRLIPKVARVPGALDGAQLLRATGPDTPREPMQVYLDHFARLDAGVVLRIAKGMHHHSAADILASVDCPAFVIVGTQDTFTPPEIGHEFVEHMPDAELMEVEHGTHCAIIEFPGRINRAVLDFLDRRIVTEREPEQGTPSA